MDKLMTRKEFLRFAAFMAVLPLLAQIKKVFQFGREQSFSLKEARHYTTSRRLAG